MPWRIIINFIVFQIGWLACVIGGAQHLPWLGTLLTLLYIPLHIMAMPAPRQELYFILLVGLLGLVWDSILVATGLTLFPSGILLENTAPHWIVALWILFASTVNVSLRWLQQRWILAAILGAIAGPASYYIGQRLGGVDFNNMLLSLTVLAVAWAFFMPLILWLSERFDGMAPYLQKDYAHA